jgi:uncharacterized protein (TIGR00251 family)
MIVDITVKPGSSRSEIVTHVGELVAYLRSRPIDGKANEELMNLLAEYFDVSPSSVSFKFGHTSRKKRVLISE